jgi:hypothetical protein
MRLTNVSTTVYFDVYIDKIAAHVKIYQHYPTDISSGLLFA